MFGNFNVTINFQPLIDVVYKGLNALWGKIGSVKTELEGGISTAKGEAIAAASADATAKATAAQSAAAVDASTKSNTAKSEAIAAASSDATSKANAAQSGAISTAASDASVKANAAKSEAITAAASDATTKATTAETNAKTHAETKASEAQSAAQSFATTQVAGLVNGESTYNDLVKVGDELRILKGFQTDATSDLDAVRDIALNGGSGLVPTNLTGLVWADFAPKTDKDGEAVLGQTTYRFAEQSDDQTVLLDFDLSAYSQLSPYLDGDGKLTVGHMDDLLITWGGTIAAPVITDVKYIKDKTHELLKAGMAEVVGRIDTSVDANVQAAHDAIMANLVPELATLVGNL